MKAVLNGLRALYREVSGFRKEPGRPTRNRKGTAKTGTHTGRGHNTESVKSRSTSRCVRLHFHSHINFLSLPSAELFDTLINEEDDGQRRRWNLTYKRRTDVARTNHDRSLLIDSAGRGKERRRRPSYDTRTHPAVILILISSTQGPWI